MKTKNENVLDSFKELKQGWNGYDGEPIDLNIIERVQHIIKECPQVQIFPTGRGGVQIEVFIDEYNLLEVELSDEGVLAYLVLNEAEVELILTDEKAKATLLWFIELFWEYKN